MRTEQLDYNLPEELVAQRPAENRDESRLLVLNRASGAMTVDVFRNLAVHLRPGDCLVLNDTRVIPARLRGKKATGGEVEMLLLRETGPGSWEALVKPSRRVRNGTAVFLTSGLTATVGDVLPGGRRLVRFNRPDVLGLLETTGEIPLPPYIHRRRPSHEDVTRYQTIYARVPGAVAAPTAGLHFTREVFDSLARAGIPRAYLTLHVGYGTFHPIHAENVADHQVEPEEFHLPEETASTLNDTRSAGGRVVAVGTTCTRVLETQFRDGLYQPGSGVTSLYIYPPYAFRAVDALQTNFHLPRSSLLALVCAFAGMELTMDAYRFAIQHRFRFYSYGDAMLIL